MFLEYLLIFLVLLCLNLLHKNVNLKVALKIVVVICKALFEAIDTDHAIYMGHDNCTYHDNYFGYDINVILL